MTKIVIFCLFWWCVWKSYHSKIAVFNHFFHFHTFESKWEDFAAQIWNLDEILVQIGLVWWSKLVHFGQHHHTKCQIWTALQLGVWHLLQDLCAGFSVSWIAHGWQRGMSKFRVVGSAAWALAIFHGIARAQICSLQVKSTAEHECPSDVTCFASTMPLLTSSLPGQAQDNDNLICYVNLKWARIGSLSLGWLVDTKDMIIRAQVPFSPIPRGWGEGTSLLWGSYPPEGG